jgi:predicted ribosome quality control (RQC) complex YloA/Tae2 family protein
MSFEGFSQAMRDEKYDAVRALAVKLGLGGEYAEELCARAGVEKEKKASDLSLGELDILYSALQSVKNFDGKGYIYYDSDGSAVSVMPVESKLYEALERKEYEDFPKAIEAYVELMGRSKDKKSAEIRRAEEELIRVEELIEESYLNYGEIYETLAKGKEFQLHDFTFDPQKSVEQNMQVLYLTRKAMREKIEGLKRAKEVEKKANMEREKEKEKKERTHKHEIKKEWYERYWWFFTSENFLVVAGKNAIDNERIVKRYLTDDDFYVHADIHGGSSGVIKTYGKDPSEITFREACCFVACFSKAWGSISSCDAYWVKADQVSKTPPSGQFLSKGSFMIYGKKNYYKELPMRLAAGVVKIDGDEKVMCAPESAISGRSTKYVMIVPGKKRAEQAAKEISKILGVEENEIANIPTRGVEIENTP